ncbi:DUF1870 family protein [Utexia brackfieldae]|uniref:Aca2/YdiL-like domain-containing protein n=1 Tax=Utexia brackfieldae TaxID=3074108 RepID=UPI00370DCBC9
MYWNKINNHELQALRKLLMLDVSEAAEFVAKVSARTWQYYESGGRPIPKDVETEMYALIQFRSDLIDELELNLNVGDKIKYYHSFKEWLDDGKEDNKVQWKIHQSAVSAIFADGNDIELI